MESLGLAITPWVPVIALWTVAWKGWALWIAARQREKYWFIALLLLNTVGILPILYIYFFSKRKKMALITQDQIQREVAKVSDVSSEKKEEENN
jgi:hypothetical protein